MPVVAKLEISLHVMAVGNLSRLDFPNSEILKRDIDAFADLHNTSAS